MTRIKAATIQVQIMELVIGSHSRPNRWNKVGADMGTSGAAVSTADCPGEDATAALSAGRFETNNAVKRAKTKTIFTKRFTRKKMTAARNAF